MCLLLISQSFWSNWWLNQPCLSSVNSTIQWNVLNIPSRELLKAMVKEGLHSCVWIAGRNNLILTSCMNISLSGWHLELFMTFQKIKTNLPLQFLKRIYFKKLPAESLVLLGSGNHLYTLWRFTVHVNNLKQQCNSEQEISAIHGQTVSYYHQLSIS